jgi:hypothetical protein
MRRILLALLFALPIAAPAMATNDPFPRVWSYAGNTEQGAPLLRAPDLYQPMDLTAVRDRARFGINTIEVSPWANVHGRNRPDVPQQLRAYNPGTMTLGYFLMQEYWVAPPNAYASTDSTLIGDYTRCFLMDKRPPSTWLYNAGSNQVHATYNVNWGNPAFCDSVQNLLVNAIKQRDATGHYTLDGLFFDYFDRAPSWAAGNPTYDYARAGYSGAAAMDTAFSHQIAKLCDAIHAARPDAKLFVNAAGWVAHTPQWLDRFGATGQMREGFENGLMPFDTALAFVRQPSPTYKLIKSEETAYPIYSALDCTRARYTLGVSCLGDGWAYLGGGANYRTYVGWYDEYSVDPLTGVTDTTGAHTGWLGQPLGPVSSVIWQGTAPDAITNTSFETDVTSGWTFSSFAPASATISRDATTAGLGAASAKIHIATPGTVDWHVSLNSVGKLTLVPGTSYSATFRCRSSSPRTVHVLALNSGADRLLNVDTNWRQYQVVITPTTSIVAGLSFFLGTQAGDVWFDDVHFQAGATSVWRRDFQNGIVLANPTELPLTVPLENPFRRIQGVRAPTVNNGAISPTQTIPPHEALFLLRASLDTTRPAAVQNLHPGP